MPVLGSAKHLTLGCSGLGFSDVSSCCVSSVLGVQSFRFCELRGSEVDWLWHCRKDIVYHFGLPTSPLYFEYHFETC